MTISSFRRVWIEGFWYFSLEIIAFGERAKSWIPGGIWSGQNVRRTDFKKHWKTLGICKISSFWKVRFGSDLKVFVTFPLVLMHFVSDGKFRFRRAFGVIKKGCTAVFKKHYKTCEILIISSFWGGQFEGFGDFSLVFIAFRERAKTWKPGGI